MDDTYLLDQRGDLVNRGCQIQVLWSLLGRGTAGQHLTVDSPMVELDEQFCLAAACHVGAQAGQ